MGENSGTESIQINLPEGGLALVIGNIIQQGSRSIDGAIISCVAENAASGVLSLYTINNTIVNDTLIGGTFLKMRAGTLATVMNNIFYGPGKPWSKVGTRVVASNNYREPEFNNSPRFVNPREYNYRIFSDSPCVNAGTLLGLMRSFDLMPRRQYLYDAQSQQRIIRGNIDIGAFEALRD